MSVDWDTWMGADSLTAVQAVALSYGCDPKLVELLEWASPTTKARHPKWVVDQGHGNGGMRHIDGFEDRLTVFTQSHPPGGLSFREFAKWVREKKWVLPADFPSAEGLQPSGADPKREEMRAMRAAGATDTAIAQKFLLTRQRVAALIGSKTSHRLANAKRG